MQAVSRLILNSLSPSLTRILSAATFLNNCFAESCFGNFRPLRRLGSPFLNLYCSGARLCARPSLYFRFFIGPSRTFRSRVVSQSSTQTLVADDLQAENT